ncbi:MAG TPA: hypothetical protein VMH22_08875 [bacterium]|nr:hypothetical protein [bacterium]
MAKRTEDSLWFPEKLGIRLADLPVNSEGRMTSRSTFPAGRFWPFIPAQMMCGRWHRACTLCG